MDFENKKVFIAPYSTLTQRLHEILLKKNIQLLGFIDKNAKGKNIFKLPDMAKKNFDYVLILSPNHFHNMYDEYSLHINFLKLVHVSLGDEEYDFKIYDKKPQQKPFAHLPSNQVQEKNKIVFISENFISSNNKYFYLFCQNINKNTIMLTSNDSQLNELQKHNLNVKKIGTEEADYEIATTKFLIFDQVGYDEKLPPLTKEQITIQQWHGVGLKKLTSTSKRVYDYYISTSSWTNRTNFQKIFNARNFVNYGYARNDVLLKPKLSSTDILFCDTNILNHITKSDATIALYMPTYRTHKNSLSLNLEALNQQLKAINTLMILKLHPFMLTYYKHKIENQYENILIHNTHGDIYPLLRYVDILISDYSSVVYDFLLLDRKIIFYVYDKKQYNKTMEFLFDYDEFSPGVQVKKIDELVQEMANEKDKYKEKRAKVLKQFFDFYDGNSSKRIYENIIQKELK